MDIKTKILDATIEECAEKSIYKISTISIAENAGCSEANVFKIYKNKANLLYETFIYIDSKLIKFLDFDLPEDIETIEEFKINLKKVWETIINFFYENPKYAIFCHYFRDSKLYDSKVMEFEFNASPKLNRYFAIANEKFHIYKNINKMHYWLACLDFSINYIKRIVEGLIPADNSTSELAFNIIIDFLSYNK